MNFLVIALVLLTVKNFTSQQKGSKSDLLFSILKLAATAKECGLFDLLKGEKPLSSLLSGEIPIDRLMELFSALPKENENPSPAPKTNVEDLSGEEMGRVLKCFLDESCAFSG